MLNAVQPDRQSVAKETLFDEGDGYETDDGAEDALEKNTRQYLATVQDVEKTVEKPIWIKPNATPGLRTLSTPYISLGQRPAFLQFLADKHSVVKQSDTAETEMLVQLKISKCL